MAKTKITALTELTDTNIAIGDLIPIVDISDTSQAASGTTKKVTITSLATAVASAFSGDSPTFVNLNTTGTTTLGDSGDATTVNGTLAVTGATTLTGTGTTLTLNPASGDAGYTLKTNSTTRGGMSIDSTGNNYIGGLEQYGLGIFVANKEFAVSVNNGTSKALAIASTGTVTIASGQITFPAAQNASADANTLDDYEEGTWTPVIGGSTSTSGQSYSPQNGSYTKIGRSVSLYVYVNFTNKGTITGNLQVQGLPFTAASSPSNAVGNINVSYWITQTNFSSIFGNVSASTTVAGIEGINASANTTTSLTTSDLHNSSAFILAIHYISN